MNPQKPSLLICCPASWGYRRSETALWLEGLATYLGQEREFPVENIGRCAPKYQRIDQYRNETVNEAKRLGFTHLLMIDPDMVPDRYVGLDPRAAPFWPNAWSWIQEHPGSVVAAPYRGEPPKCDVQVFRDDSRGKLKKYTDAEAIRCEGWHSVGAVGTGLMLIDMAIISKLKKPYFKNVYWGEDEAGLLIGEDVAFSINCRDHDIPVWVNFSCWCGHMQMGCVEKPFWDAVHHKSLVEVVPDGHAEIQRGNNGHAGPGRGAVVGGRIPGQRRIDAIDRGCREGSEAACSPVGSPLGRLPSTFYPRSDSAFGPSH